MSTAELRSGINQLLERVNDDSVLQAIYTLLSKATPEDDWYEGLSEKAKRSIQRGIEDADNGRFVTSEEVQVSVNKRLGRV